MEQPTPGILFAAVIAISALAAFLLMISLNGFGVDGVGFLSYWGLIVAARLVYMTVVSAR